MFWSRSHGSDKRCFLLPRHRHRHHQQQQQQQQLHATLHPPPDDDLDVDILALLRSLCHAGDLDSALNLLPKLPVAASDDAYSSLLRACVRRKALFHAREVYTHVCSRGVTLDGFLGDYLVVALAKCGAIRDASSIFRSLRRRTVFSWNAIISSYVDSGCSKEALAVFCGTMMPDVDQVEPDSYTYVSLIKACGNTMNPELGRMLHAAVCMEGLASDAFVVSTLISMYGKFGQVPDAEVVFVMQSQPNGVVSWNAMMSAYLQQGRSGKAIRLYRQILDEDVDSDHHTIVFAVQACCNLLSDDRDHVEGRSAKLASLEIGNAVHAYAHKKAFTKSTYVGTALLGMYGKCESVEEAENVFISLPQRNVVSWNAMVSAYVSRGQGDKALHLYVEMQKEGVWPNELTYAMSLQACSLLAEKEEPCLHEGQPIKVISSHIGQALHGDLHANGFGSDLIVGTALLNMYGKLGAITEAEKAFLSLPHKDIVAWNSLMSTYLEQRDARKAFQAYRQIYKEEIDPRQITFVLALQACGALAESGENISQNDQSKLSAPLHIGRALHSDARRKGLASDMIVSNTLVSMYGKCGAVSEAEHLCGRIQRNVVTWNALLSTYVEQLEGAKALQSFVRLQKEGIEPNELTYVVVLQACCLLIEMEECFVSEEATIEVVTLQIGQALHDDVRKRGFASSVFIGTALLTMYGRCGAVLEAENIFSALPVRDTVSWNALLGAYVQHNQGEKALQLFRQMQREGTSSHQRTFVMAMQACGNIAKKEETLLFKGPSAKAMAFELGQALHEDAHYEGHASGTLVGNTLLSMYRKCGAIIKAEATFKEILHPDSISWNSMLSTYVEQNRGEQAIRLCKQIQTQKSDIDEVTLMCILQASSLMGGLETCRYIHFGVVSAGCDHNPSISVAVIHGYGSCSSMLNAQAFFDELTEPNLVIWNAWLAGHASEGNHVSSLEVFELLQMNSLRADELTYTSLLSVCSHAGLVSTGLQCFLCMMSNTLTPDLRHYGALVDILGRAGDFKRAENLVQRLPIPANSAIWLSLLGACRTHNNLQLAKEVFDNAVDASPNDAAAFVILSDVYALAG